MHIKTIEQVLTDQSRVYDVALVSEGKAIRVPCYTKEDADLLVEKLSELFSKHTLEPVTIR
jgi:hypothetical protein